MAIKYSVQTSFSSGKIDPILMGNPTLGEYRSSLLEATNVLPLKTGGITKRQGSLYIGNSKYNSSAPRLIAFEYDKETKFLLEFGREYIRFIKNGSPQYFLNEPIEIQTPYSKEEVTNLKYAFFNKSLFLVCSTQPPMQLSYNEIGQRWSLTEIECDGPYNERYEGEIEFTWNGGTGESGEYASVVASANLFQDHDMGRSIMFYNGTFDNTNGIKDTLYSSCIITEVLSSTEVTVKWLRGPKKKDSFWDGSTAAKGVYFGVFGEISSLERDKGIGAIGYPSLIVNHEGRLVYGASEGRPLTIWGSSLATNRYSISDNPYTSFYKYIEEAEQPDDMSYSYSFIDDKISKINWMVSTNILSVGLSTKEIRIGNVGSDVTITPTRISVISETTFGSSSSVTANLLNGVLFFDSTYTKLIYWYYSFLDGSCVGNVLSSFTDLLNGSKPISIKIIYAEYIYIYLLFEDGRCLVVACNKFDSLKSRDIENQFVGWFEIKTNDIMQSIETLVSKDNNLELWWIARRNCEYGNYNSIEQTSQENTREIYSDNATYYIGPPTDTLNNLSRFEGVTVSIVADGGVLPDQTISDGILILEKKYKSIIVGERYIASIKTLPIVVSFTENPLGSSTFKSIGMQKAYRNMIVYFYKTLNAKYKIDDEIVPFRNTFMQTDTAVPPFTGYYPMILTTGFKYDDSIELFSDTPTPFTIVAIGIWYDISERFTG